MKKHLVIICGMYYPNPSPTGLCVKRFVQLLRELYDIDIICLSDKGEKCDVFVEDGVQIHVISGKLMSLENKYSGILKKLLHLVDFFQIKTRMLGNLSWFRKCAYKELEKVHSKYKVDVVFTICSPFAAHFVGSDFKKNHCEVRWCGYTVDPYATKNRIRPIGAGWDKLIHVEHDMLTSMDAVMLSEEVYRNRPELYCGGINCFCLPYMLPDFQEIEKKGQYFDSHYINCLYAGSFYSDIRNPEGMLQCFSALDESDIKLHLFSHGCEDIVEKYRRGNDNIIVHDQVSHDKMAEVYSEADVFVSVGNATPEFMPSKIYEYIVSCKPIVNFYTYGHGESALDSYPCCLQISNKEAEEKGEQLRKFLKKHSRNIIPKNEILRIYHKNSAEAICEILSSALRG